MATELRYRLYEEMYGPEPYTSRKEASILGRLDVENYNASPNRRRATSVDPDERGQARRRRIYENEYNRPYPARKKMHMWTAKDVFSSTERVSSQVTPSPTTKKSSSFWGDMSMQDDDDDFIRDDESIDELAPRELWKRVTCHSIGTFGTKVVNRVNSLSRPSTDGTSTIDFSSEVEPDSSIMMLASTTDSRMVTPKRQTSKSFLLDTNDKDNNDDKNNDNDMTPADPTTPTTDTSTPCSNEMNLEGACLIIPSAPMKKTLDRIRPMVQESAAVLRSRWHRATTQDKRKASWQIPELQKHNESLGKLHKFLHSPTENQLKLYIDDYQESTFDRIVESFYGNTHLTSLMIQRQSDSYSPGTYRSRREMICLFEAIRCLPHLKTLIVVNAQEDIVPALVENLPRNLRALKLHVVEGDIPTFCLDVLAQTNLKKIDLEVEESIDIGRLIHSSSIQCIKVRGVKITVDANHMQSLADALSCNPFSSLKSLEIEPWMDFTSWKHLAEALRYHGSIESIIVRVGADSCDEADAAAVVLAELLQANTTLTHIVNKTHESLMVAEETVNGPVLEALLANKTIKKLRFFDEDPLFWMAKDAILKRNKDSVTEKEDGDYSQAIFDHYVKFAALLPGFKQKMCAYC